MDFGAIIGIIIGIGGVLVGYMLEGGSITALLHEPSPFLIVFGGCAGAVVLTFPIPELKKIPAALKNAFTFKKNDPVSIINDIAKLSEKARKDGLLSLEQDAQTHENEFIKKGLALVVDGIETEVIRDILVRESELRQSMKESASKVFESAGGYAPTMGVLGTVMGMVQVLSTMNDDPSSLGSKVAVAFLATLFGVASANLVFLPIAGRIKSKAEEETMINDLIIEGLLSLQAGENPRIIKEKLNLTLLEKINGYNKGGLKAENEINEKEKAGSGRGERGKAGVNVSAEG